MRYNVLSIPYQYECIDPAWCFKLISISISIVQPYYLYSSRNRISNQFRTHRYPITTLRVYISFFLFGFLFFSFLFQFLRLRLRLRFFLKVSIEKDIECK